MYSQFVGVPYESVRIRRPFFSFRNDIEITDPTIKAETLFKVIGRMFVYIESIDFSTNLPEDVYKSILRNGLAPQINFISEDGDSLYNFKPIKLINYAEIYPQFGFMVENKKNSNIQIAYTPNWQVSPELIEYGAEFISANISVNYGITTEEKFINRVVRGF